LIKYGVPKALLENCQWCFFVETRFRLTDERLANSKAQAYFDNILIPCQSQFQEIFS